MVDEALGLAAAYRASATAHPDLADRLTPIADTHTAHATELARVVGVTLGSAPTADPSATVPAEPAAALAGLRAREKAAQQSATAACTAAPAERAALLGSIAAARATHQEALK